MCGHANKGSLDLEANRHRHAHEQAFGIAQARCDKHKTFPTKSARMHPRVHYCTSSETENLSLLRFHYDFLPIYVCGANQTSCCHKHHCLDTDVGFCNANALFSRACGLILHSLSLHRCCFVAASLLLMFFCSLLNTCLTHFS